jgi:pimeloyl-ACP methyl ester carboxylesterase
MTLTAIIIFITLIIFPYAFNSLKLKNPKKIKIPLYGNHAKLSKGKIYYRWHEPEVLSSNEIIVLIHGFSTPSFVWNGIMEDLLKTGRRVLAYDHFGRGFSDRPNQKYNLNFYVDTLNELLEFLEEPGDIHLVGYSMGGPIAAMFAHQNKEKIKTLNLIAPAGYIPDSHWIMKLFMLPLVGDYLFKAFPSIYKKISASETHNSDDPKAINQKEFEDFFIPQTLYKGFVESLLSTARNFDMTDSSDAFKKIGKDKINTQVIWGDLDGVVPISGYESLKNDVPQVHFREIKEGTHDITYRQPTEVAKYLFDFIK